MQSCSMSNCPMSAPPEAEGCHGSEVPVESESSDCHAGPELGIACCAAPIDPEPAKVDSQVSSAQTEAPLVVLAKRIEPRPPSKPPDLIAETISSQQYELGRFTLLSSFLL